LDFVLQLFLLREVYGLDGRYLGEIKGNLLIINQAKKSPWRTVSTLYAKRAGKSKPL